MILSLSYILTDVQKVSLCVYYCLLTCVCRCLGIYFDMNEGIKLTLFHVKMSYFEHSDMRYFRYKIACSSLFEIRRKVRSVKMNVSPNLRDLADHTS